MDYIKKLCDFMLMMAVFIVMAVVATHIWYNTSYTEYNFESKLIDIDAGYLIFESGDIVEMGNTRFRWVTNTTYNVTINLYNGQVKEQRVVGHEDQSFVQP